jgi:hypothetical protein
MAPFHTRNSVHTDPNGIPITASFFMVIQIPGKLLEFPICSPAILKIQSCVGSWRPRPVSSRSVVAPPAPQPPGATRRAEPGAQGQCEKRCSAGVLRRDGGPAGVAASALPFAAPAQHDGT